MAASLDPGLSSQRDSHIAETQTTGMANWQRDIDGLSHQLSETIKNTMTKVEEARVTFVGRSELLANESIELHRQLREQMLSGEITVEECAAKRDELDHFSGSIFRTLRVAHTEASGDSLEMLALVTQRTAAIIDICAGAASLHGLELASREPGRE